MPHTHHLATWMLRKTPERRWPENIMYLQVIMHKCAFILRYINGPTFPRHRDFSLWDWAKFKMIYLIYVFNYNILLLDFGTSNPVIQLFKKFLLFIKFFH